MRTFISIDMPEEIRKEIKKNQNSLPEFYGKFTELENLHLTLKFLGEVDEEKVEKVKEKLREIQSKKFESEINSIGVFSEKFVRIVWLHLSNCEGLQKIVDESLVNLFDKEKIFMSHLTIARVKKLQDKEHFLNELKKIKIPKVKFAVDKFKLKMSTLTKQGPVYETIEEYDLN